MTSIRACWRASSWRSVPSIGGSCGTASPSPYHLQVLLILVSPEVLIEHTPSASEQVKKAGETALEKYTEMSGRTSKIEYKDSLSDDTCSGGIIGSMMQGRIKVDNTLDARLKILEEKVSDLDRTQCYVC